MTPVNERQWQGRVLRWISEYLKEQPDLPFGKIDQEFEVTINGNTRRFNDLTLFDKQNKPVCVFELKLPDKSDGRSPRYLPVVMKTHDTADALGADYFITWNVNSAVLWKTYIPNRAPYERSLVQYLSITAIRNSDALNLPEVETALRQWVQDFLKQLARIATGTILFKVTSTRFWSEQYLPNY
jgi:hypothetical protein